MTQAWGRSESEARGAVKWRDEVQIDQEETAGWRVVRREIVNREAQKCGFATGILMPCSALERLPE